MALFPKKYIKNISAEEYIRYMSDRLEHYASAEEKKKIESQRSISHLRKEIEKIKSESIKIREEIEAIKQSIQEASNE